MAHVHMLSELETGTHPHWMPAVYAGLIAGFTFILVEMLLVTMSGNSPWAPVQMIGAIALGQDALTSPATFTLSVFITAMLVHFVLAVVYSLIMSLVIFRLDTWLAIIGGAACGLVVYGINFYGFTEFFTWFTAARGSDSLVAHLIFGIVAALSYKELAERAIQREHHTPV